MSHSRRNSFTPRLCCLAAIVFAALVGSSLWRVPSASGRNSEAPRAPGARANDAIHTSSPTLIYIDNVNAFSAGASGCCPCFCPGTPMTPGSVTYHVPRSFFITGLTVDNDDFSGNNHNGMGNIRAQVLDLSDNLVAESTNTLYGESGTHDFTFGFEGQLVAQDFKLRLVVTDAIQAAAGFNIYHLRFFEDVTPVLKQPAQLNPETGGLVPEGAQTIENPVAFGGVVRGFPFQSKLQVEVQPFGEAFTGAPVVETQLAAPGTNVSVAAPALPDGPYHWQARTVDSEGNASQWQEFGGAGNVDFVIKDTPTFPQIYADTITVFRGDNLFASGCCPNFVLSPGQVTYHLPAGFLINELTVDNDDFSGNNRAGFGNFRARIFDADGNAIASSTNVLWGQFGLHDFNFHFGGRLVPKDFKVSFVGEDLLQGGTSFTVRNLRFVGDPTPPPTTGCAAAPSDLVGWWPGDGNANDKSGNGNNGTARNGLTYSNGEVQQAFNLDGTDGFVNVPDSSSFDAITAAVSVEAWIKPDVPPSSRGFVFARRDPNVSESFSLVIYGDGKIGVNLRTTGIHPNGSIWVSSPGVIQFGQWQHVAATFAAATGQLNVYVNGQGRALSVVEGPSTFGGNLADVHNLFIGRRQDLNDIGGIEGEFGASYFKGLIDELSLYGRALSAGEIQAIYNAGAAGKCAAAPPTCAPAPAGAEGGWAGDGDARDFSGNANDGTLQNGATFATGKVGQAFDLTHGLDRVEIPHSPSLDFTTSDEYSVDFWMKTQPHSNAHPALVEKWSEFTNGSYPYVVRLNTGQYGPPGTIFVAAFDGTNTRSVDSVRRVDDNAWHHVAAVFRHSQKKLEVYIDGSLDNSSVYTTLGSISNGDPLSLGIRPSPSASREADFNYDGLLDEVVVYGRALSAADIQSIYNAGGAGRCRVGSSPRPSASFGFAPAAPAVGQAVQFTDSSAGQSLKWSWDFDGNGFEDETLQNPSHAFSTPGPYKVTLRVTNAYGTSSVTHTVNVGGATIGPGVPFVTGVTRQYPGLFFAGTDLSNRFDVDVNWNGSPGTVRFSINGGQPAVENGVPFGASHSFNMGRDFPAKLSASTITITPVNASGTIGPAWTEHVFVSPLPSWASGPANWVLSKGELKFSLPFEVPVPHWEAKRKVPDIIPYIGGKFGINETFFKGDFEFSSNGYGSLTGFGQTGFMIKRPNGVEYSLDGALGATVEGRWDGPKGVQITKGAVRVQIKGTIAQEQGLFDVIPQFSVFSGLPVVRELNNKAKLRFEFSPSFDGSFAFYQKGQGLGFSDAEGTLGAKPSVTLRVPLINKHLEARAWAAGNAEMTFGTPGTFFRRGKLGIQLGAALIVNAFWKVQFCPSATYNFGCTYTGGEGWNCAPGTGSTSEDCPGPPLSAVHRGAYPLELIRPNYARFGGRSQFKTETLVRRASTKIPQSVRETQFVNNIFQGATPNLAGSGTGRMLLWVSQDESLPVLQSTDVSWSYNDGTNWTTPAPVAHDTRAELAPVSGVAPDGKVVAAWLRIKDPEFTTPVNTIDDLPLFYRKLEVVSAVFDPASKTWGPVTQLTDDESFDTDVHISSDGSGNLLLTWLSNDGGLFTSDGANPSALKYAFWNGSGWSTPAVVAGNLIGVSGHAAALHGSGAFIVLPRDPDADAADDGVLDLYTWDGTAWSGPASFAAGGVENRLPSAVYDAAGEGHVVWLRGDDLVHATLGDHTPHVVRAGSESMAFYSTQLLVNPQGNLTLTWQESADNGPANIFATVYDTASQTWSADRRLTESPQEAQDVSGFYGADGQLHLAYLSTAIERVPKDVTLDDGSTITIQNVPQDGRTDLLLLDHSLIVDLAVGDEDISVSPRAPRPADSVEALVAVHNAGDFAVGTFAVNLYAGDPDSGGLLVGSANVAGPLAAGDQRTVNFSFIYPEAAGNLVAVVDAANAVAEFSEENNRATSYVTNRPPEAVAVADATEGAPPLAVSFDASASADPDGDAVSYLWSFGDGGPNASGAQVAHSFTQTGLYPVTLTVTDSHGAVGSATVSVNVGCTQLSFSPASPAGGRVGAPYGQTISVTGGAQPYSFAVTAGELPEGLTLQPSGELTGTPTATGTSLFTVSATYANGCESSADYSIEVEPASADVSITKTASVNPAEVGRIFTYNITVSNAGPSAAAGVTVTDALTGGVTFTSAVPSQGSCAYASGTLTCRLGTLAANGSASVALQVKPRQTGTLVNTASVASETDTNNSNNHATSSINVIKTADVKVSMSDSPDPVFVGEQVTYTMLVTNLGPLNSATGVALTDLLPLGMTFVSAATTQGSLITPPVGSTGIVTANIGSLAVSAQATVTVTVKTAQSGAISNGASVSLNETDTNTSNNTATQTTTVKDAALLKVLLAKQVLVGGCENTTGNVYLTGPAPPGGVSVPLSSNVTGAGVPASVFIAAGQSASPAFNVTTTPVTAKQVGLVIAGSGVGSISRGITINVGSGSCP